MKHLLLILTLSTILASCGKDVPGLTVDEYITANNLTTTELAEGVHIIIHASGTGFKPNINSNIVIAYEGRLTDGSVFDSNDSYNNILSGLIRGWQVGMPEISIGGSCTLIIPPSAGYGSRATGSIPANSTLIFDIDLLDIII
ncbi:MAG: FKBP-type peptidyl-prolyl cis-trans isomerase FkpA [Halioglobus sp.]|jgi:FKBP-type peptidyl-prolyl cis-trans isomerase FkpA